ncbi:MAG: alkaline phosphatase, partial [Haliea sp.]
PLSSETHAGEDVAVYASGPGASLVRGTNEQNVLFHITDYALDLIARANAAAN